MIPGVGMRRRVDRGIVLVIVVALLSVLLVAAALFMHISSSRRGVDRAAVERARARLLAASGVESAFARLWRSPAPPAVRTVANASDDWTCRESIPSIDLGSLHNPSFHLGEPWADVGAGGIGVYSDGTDAFLAAHDRSLDGRHTPYSGRLRGTHHGYGDRFLLRISSSGIHVNGIDSPGGEDVDGNGAQAIGILVNGVAFPDANEPDLNGNGVFDRTRLEFMINNLALSLIREGRGGGLTGREGTDLMAARPPGGFPDRTVIRTVLGAVRYAAIAPYLSLHAWEDPKVARPVRLMDRPYLGYRNWQYAVSPANSIAGFGDVAYAWKDLNPGPVSRGPRAPVDVQTAPLELLTACFTGLTGLYVSDEVHPLFTRVSGFSTGQSSDSSTGRFHYGIIARHHNAFDKQTTDTRIENNWPNDNGRIGIVRRSVPISLPQGIEIARAIVDRRAALGSFGTWRDFSAWVDASLPLDEDLPRGTPYSRPLVTDSRGFSINESVAPPNGVLDYGEDVRNFQVLDREFFPGPDGTPGTPDDVPGLNRYQKDALKAMADPNTDLNDFNPDAVLYKEIDKTDLHVWTTELSLGATGYFRIESIGRVESPAADGRQSLLRAEARVEAESKVFNMYRETTQRDFLREPLALPPGQFLVGNARSLRVGENEAVPPPTFSENRGTIAQETDGGRALQSYPEPVLPVVAANPARAIRLGADIDGQIGLATINSVGFSTAPALRMDFDGQGVDAVAGYAGWNPVMVDDSELLHDYPELLRSPGAGQPGALHPDGLYSELHASAQYNVPRDADWDLEGTTGTGGAGGIAFWWKPHWFPERTQKVRIPFGAPNRYEQYVGWPPTSTGGFPLNVMGLFFFPAVGNPERSVYVGYSTDAVPGWDNRCIGWGMGFSNSTGGGVQGYRVTRSLNHVGHIVGGTSGHTVGSVDFLRHHQWMHIAIAWQSAIGSGLSRVNSLPIYVNGNASLGNVDNGIGTYIWGETMYPRNTQRNLNINDGSRNRFCFGAWSRTNQSSDGLITAGPVFNGAPDATLDAIRIYPNWDSAVRPGDVTSQWRDGRYYKAGNGAGTGFFTSAPINAAILGLPPGTVWRILSISWTGRMPPDNGDPATPRPLVDPADPGQPASLQLSYAIDGAPWIAPSTSADSIHVLAQVVNDARYRIDFRVTVPSPATEPLLTSPYLDDVTVRYTAGGRATLLAWEEN